MTEFGGLGGIPGGRDRDPQDLFEAAVDKVMGERLRAEGPNGEPWFEGTNLGCRLWGSLANVDWKHENGDTASYSFRAAGDMIASVIGDGDYLDWYCSYDFGVVDPEVAELLATEGWTPIPEEVATLETQDRAPDEES